MASSILLHQFRLNSVPRTEEFPTRVNIKKRREQVVYKTLSNQDNINISYAIGESTNPRSNLIIYDRSTSLVQNRIPFENQLQITTASILTLNVDKFLVTDIFTSETPTKPSTPLFYQHQFKNYDPENSSQSLLSFEFLDKELRAAAVSEYQLNSSLGYIYNNLQNTFNKATLAHAVFFLKYTVRTINGSQQSITVYHELIDNNPIFIQADFDDLDDYGNIIPGRKKYLIEALPGGDFFEIRLPVLSSGGKYGVKEISESRIKILEPTAKDTSSLWSLRVTNGQFITSLPRNKAGLVSNYKYYLAEFNAQTFFPFPPYKFITNEPGTWLSSFLIKTSKNIAHDLPLGLYVDILVKDTVGNLKKAFSNNPDKINTTVGTSIIKYLDQILSIDQLNGFLEVGSSILDIDQITVSYYTKEKEYEFTTIDFNPVNNVSILNQRIVLYLTPESITTGTLSSSLYYLVVNSLGEITYSNQAATSETSLDAASIQLTTEDFLTDGTPRHTFYYDRPSSSEGLQSRHSGVFLGNINEFSFIDKYTVESVLFAPVLSTLVSGVSVDQNFEENPKFLVLADVYVGESQSPEALSTFDVRVQGGGIKEDLKEEALQIQPEVSWYWDFNAKKPYPAGGAFYAEIPQDILSDFGGRFTKEQVKDIFARHMKFGGYAVIKDYGVDPVITETETTSGTAYFCWPSYGNLVTYNAYYSKDPVKNFIKVNSSTITDTSSGNCVTVTGLNPSTSYYVKVEALKGESGWSESQTVKLTTASVIS